LVAQIPYLESVLAQQKGNEMAALNTSTLLAVARHQLEKLQTNVSEGTLSMEE
jgi:hypothetical protein